MLFRKQAFERLANFITENKELSQAFFGQNEPTEKQTQELIAFLINDPFFQNYCIEAIKNSENGQWVEKLDKQAQMKFLKKLTSISQMRLKNKRTRDRLASQLLADPEIGPALKDSFGNKLDPKIFKEQQKILENGSANVPHKRQELVNQVQHQSA